MTNSNGFKFNRPDSPVTLAAVDIHLSRNWGNFGDRPGERPPVLLNGKVPNAGKNWQDRRFHSEDGADVVKHFTDGGVLAGANLGVLLGNGLADVDLDCSEARRAADLVLTPTPRRHGRPSAPKSHRWYRVDRDGAERYQDADSTTLLELRARSGLQTVVPPSIHHGTGEAIVWECPDTEPPMPRNMELDVLGAETAALAVACTLGRGNRWPRKGGRHDAYLALAGGLLRGASPDAPRADLLEHLIHKIIEALAYLTDDEQEQVRADEAVRSTWEKLVAGAHVTGWNRLGELLSDDVTVTARKVAQTAKKHATTMRLYLGLPYPGGDREAGNGESSNGSNGNAATPEEEAEEARREIARLARNERWRRAANRQVNDEEAAQREIFDPGVLDAVQMFVRYRDSAGMHLVENTIPKRGIGSFFGESGAGKSTNVGALSLHLAHGPGATWFGCGVTERVATLHVPFEAAHEAHLKAFAQAKALGYGAAELELLRWWPESSLNVLSERSIDKFVAGVGRMRDELAEAGVRLGFLNIDTQRHLHPGRSINDDSATSLVTGLLIRCAREFDLFASVIQHTPVVDDSRVAGSGEQKGAKDVQIGFTKAGVAKTEKSRFARGGVLGRYQVIGHGPVDHVGRPIADLVERGVSFGVVRELTTDEELSAAVQAMLADQNTLTQCEILARIGTPPAPTSTSSTSAPLGWSDSQVANLMRDIAKREHTGGCPMMAWSEKRRPFKDRKKISALLDELGEAGLVENLAGSRATGKPLAWLRTEKGADWVAGVGGGVCTCLPLP